ncbi:MAG: hypothetical protein HZA61_08720 [Candidatus Eisenbacteria bacterium]|uniref:FlgD Ig-like domain-containing protein n=1 Tax=Eiseniibacteriota bacterium TaxID=2212470 RepID=A0A933W927_UNCEI|nr:hypothetical protein [Candidatus Eisenbacteria bacterium]
MPASVAPLARTLLIAATLSLFAPAARAIADDPLLPMIRRTDRYLQEHAVDGVTMDWRYSVIPSEEIRQTVVCQLLAYVELARLDARPRLRTEIVRHADFLLPRLADVRSFTPFDGMLAYALLGAFEITREPRFLEAGTGITNDLLAIPTGECVLNGGLMVAMATAEYAFLTGDVPSRTKTHDIVAQLAPYQNDDGSFPHWCVGSRDIHYTGWMAMELMHIRRLQERAACDDYLQRMSWFLEGRIDASGRSVYEEPCPGVPGCTLYFYSRMTGCSFDLDSRGWTVEPAYEALLFDHLGSGQYGQVMAFLDSLEDGGTIADLFGYWPPPEDPEYPWTIADTSVVCMSINLWVLATAVADRVARGLPVDLVLDVYDAGGRRVRRLAGGVFRAGTHVIPWNGRDDRGRTCGPGVYFARFEGPERHDAVRLVRVW